MTATVGVIILNLKQKRGDARYKNQAVAAGDGDRGQSQ